IREVFEEVSPIKDFTGNLELHFAVGRRRSKSPQEDERGDLSLQFDGYRLEQLKYSVDECRERDYNYSAALKVQVRLVIKETGAIQEQYANDKAVAATLHQDDTENTEEALLGIYRRLRPGDPPTIESARTLLNTLFFDPRRYDLGRVGRYKLDKKLSLKPAAEGAPDARVVKPKDIVEIVS